jgi:2-amino-4-hydroxy-6-hydroxymethyldihydropteridine diphosphokinase
MPTVYLALGSNTGDRLAYLRLAVQGLLGNTNLTLSDMSAVYQTEPVGMTSGTPWFYNMVVQCVTTLSPQQVLAHCQAVEATLGRKRCLEASLPQNRTVDIDLLAYDELCLDTPELVLPHPRMAERAFVLVPLLELNPDWYHPVLGQNVAELHLALPRLARVELVGDLSYR